MINQVKNRLGTKGRQTNHLWSQVVHELVLITCLKGYNGTKVRQEEGMTGRRYDGMKGQRDDRTSKPMSIVENKV